MITVNNNIVLYISILLSLFAAVVEAQPFRFQSKRRTKIQFMAAGKLQALWNHPAGPKTSEFLAFRFVEFVCVFFAYVVFWWFRCSLFCG